MASAALLVIWLVVGTASRISHAGLAETVAFQP
jgi:hypothetical protein